MCVGSPTQAFLQGPFSHQDFCLGPTYVWDPAWAGKEDEEGRGGRGFKASGAAFQPCGAAGVGGGVVGAGEYQVLLLPVAHP